MNANSATPPPFVSDFLPVASREARIAARRIFAYAVRTIIAAFFALVAFRRMFAPNVDAAGPPLLQTLGWMGFMYATLAGVFKTFDSLSREKREGTLGLLLLTDLGPFQILVGKLLAASAMTVFGLIAFLPILSIPIIIGGVMVDQVIRLVVALITTLLLAMSWGLYVSANARNYITSLAGAALLLAVFAFLPLGLAANLFPASKTFIFETMICLFTPTLPFELAFTVNPDLTQFFWPSIACNLTLALAWIASAVLILPTRSHETPNKNKFLKRIRARLHEFRFGNTAQRTAIRQRLFNFNPAYWLSNRDRIYSPGLALFCVLILSVARFFHAAEFGLLIASLAILIRMAYAAAHAISEDQKNGALELLLLTTLPIREIVKGRNLAMLRRFTLPVAVVTIWPWLILDLQPDSLFRTLVIASTILLVFTWDSLAWTGTWFALRKKPIAATWTSLAVVAAPPWLIWITSIFRGLFDPTYADIQFIGAIVCCFVGVLHCTLISIWARRMVLSNFRTAAADPFATIKFEATFEAGRPKSKLKILPIGKGDVRVFRQGTTARLVAVPNDNHIFIEWAGHIRGNENPLEIELQGNAYIIARFAASTATTSTPSRVNC